MSVAPYQLCAEIKDVFDDVNGSDLTVSEKTAFYRFAADSIAYKRRLIPDPQEVDPIRAMFETDNDLERPDVLDADTLTYVDEQKIAYTRLLHRSDDMDDITQDMFLGTVGRMVDDATPADVAQYIRTEGRVVPLFLAPSEPEML